MRGTESKGGEDRVDCSQEGEEEEGGDCTTTTESTRFSISIYPIPLSICSVRLNNTIRVDPVVASEPPLSCDTGYRLLVSWNFYRVGKWEDEWSGDARRVPRREGRGSHGSHTVLRPLDGLVDGIRLASALDGRRWRGLDRLSVCLQEFPLVEIPYHVGFGASAMSVFFSRDSTILFTDRSQSSPVSRADPSCLPPLS